MLSAFECDHTFVHLFMKIPRRGDNCVNADVLYQILIPKAISIASTPFCFPSQDSQA